MRCTPAPPTGGKLYDTRSAASEAREPDGVLGVGLLTCARRSATPILVSSVTSHPLVSIVMPCLDEEPYIEDCIRSVQAQDWPRDRLEILVADGMSMDATREILARLAADGRPHPHHRQPRAHPGRRAQRVHPPRARRDHRAHGCARGVRVGLRAQLRARARAHGRRQRRWPRAGPRARTFFQRCVAAALTSPLGIGGSKYRKEGEEGWVESVWPGAFRREVFERVGLFDPHAVTNEDAELNQRIADAGGRVYLSPDIGVAYYPRESMRALARQYFKYGQGRARTLLKHRRFLSLRPALPFLWLVGEAALVATSPWQPLAPVVVRGLRARHGRRGRARRPARGRARGARRVGDLPGPPRRARRGLRRPAWLATR